MSWWNVWRKPKEQQLDSELRFHIESLTDANIAAGLSPQEARRKALVDFGGTEQVKEDLRDVHRVPVLETLAANLRYALRFIRKSPSFSLTVIVTLGLGIGANSAVFSAIDAITLKPLSFPNGAQLMRLAESHRKKKEPETFVAPVRLEDWNRLNSTFQAITGYYTQNLSETFLMQGMGVSIAGAVVGLVLAAGLTRVIAGMLYGVQPWAVPTLLMVAGLVVTVAGIASLAPAVRASRVEPMPVLRDE